jgi:hypothetical protein
VVDNDIIRMWNWLRLGGIQFLSALEFFPDLSFIVDQRLGICRVRGKVFLFDRAQPPI